jgi:quinol monooxygenase YgiN
MIRAFIRHHVSDYAAWREVYDGFDETQREHGVRAEAVYRAVDDPNDVTVTHDFDDAAAAKTFMGLPELKDAMSRSGVEGQPEIWFTEED